VVLERSSSDAWLIAPFGRFSEPAVPGEWRTGRRSAALRVLCLWNAHDLPEAICSQSWVVDRLSEQKRTTALAVRQFQLEGRSLRAVELRHVGPPLLHPLDPRHEYLEQEEGWMTVLRRFVPADVVMYSPSKDSDRTSLPLAAEERVKYRTRRDAKENPRRDDSNS
jgi:hypothetical protein